MDKTCEIVCVECVLQSRVSILYTYNNDRKTHTLDYECIKIRMMCACVIYIHHISHTFAVMMIYIYIIILIEKRS
jgi:hypothetical protein